MTEGNGEVRELPKGWVQLKLEDVAEWGSGGTPSRKNSNYFNGNIPWIKTGELRSKYIRATEEKITEEAIKKSSAKLFPKGSVAVAMYGATIGKTSILEIDASTNQACAVAKPLEKILFNEFLYYYLSSQTRKFVELGKGGAQPNISQSILKDHHIDLPPFCEQERIVERIEELFSDVDQGIETLKTAQKQLKVYRQAVLKWAFEGKLTEAWRTQQPTLKTGEALLAQIKAERENRYQQQLAEWEEKVREWEAIGSVGKKPSKPQKPKELLPLSEAELTELLQLPSEWSWGKFGSITSDLCLGKMLDKDKNKGISMPYLRNINVRWGAFSLVELVEMRFEKHEEERYGIKYGDLIICEGGEPGRAAIWREQKLNMKIQKALHRARFFENLTLNKFVMYFLFYSASTGHMSRFFTGTTIKHLTGQGLSDLTIPILSFEEQVQMVQEIESRLSICDQLEATIIENLQKAEALRQSILKQAFEGKLVPQDPSDEPAEKLLERIRAERQEKESQKASKPLRQLSLEDL